ncbi:MAG: RIP metalloprotease RseP [Pseudomonadota bacterium]|nr:RIP metalloprotease RseP [Pseudomonadota bacterium]
MGLIDILTNQASWLLSYAVPFLFVLTVVVFFHELGHFLVARWCGVAVKVFSIGFGREIFGFNDRHGTRWRVAWIPLGGYVKFVGDENAASVPDQASMKDMTEREKAGNFHLKPLPKRAAVVAAGPIANFILAVAIFAFTFTFIGQRITPALVDAVTPGSAAEKSGFQPGDLILRIDGQKIDNFGEMQRIVSTSPGRTLEFVVQRNDREVTMTAIPDRKEIIDRFGNKMNLGLLGVRRSTSADDWVLQRYDPLTALWKGVEETYFVIERTLSYLGDVIIGKEAADQLGGPLRIAQVSGQVATAGFVALLHLAAVLSVSIGLLNLFPIPLLDGGHLLFYAIEAVRGRPLSDRALEIGFRIGFAMVLMLMIFATWNDLNHFGSLFGNL